MEFREKTVFTYRVFVKGIWGRNRSVKFEGFDLAGDQELPLPEAEIRSRTHIMVADLKIKPGSVIKVVERKEIIKDYGDGCVMRLTMLLTDARDIFEERLA